MNKHLARPLIAFDMGNVLLPFDHMTACRAVAEKTGVRAQTIYERLFNSGIEGAFETGELDEKQFLATCSNALGVKLSVDWFRPAWCDIFRTDTRMEELVAELRGRVDLCLVSNTNPWHFDYVQQRFGVLQYFDHCVLSYLVGSMKPSKAMYEQAISVVAGPRVRLFIDDLEENVKAARSHGFEGIVFRGAEFLARHETIRDFLNSDDVNTVGGHRL